MEQDKKYTLPLLPYDYKALAPYMSEEQIRIHHDKHHLSYVKGANLILEKLENARKRGEELDMGAILKKLSFNVGGNSLHSLFWQNMAPANNGGGGEPTNMLMQKINEEFQSFNRFKKEFTESTMSIEGSGWSALSYDKELDRLLITHIQIHNKNIYPTFPILMVLDFWEHAYYIDYKSEKAKFIEAFWNIVNWEEVNRRFEKARSL
ncbi:MAG: superoxide dismutase [Candidatus Pacebacteria bacterium]|nr:superoxide dismutase [Candidatus Paceibacterota bacterium]